MVDFVKLMFEGGMDIKPYVVYSAITEDQYKDITGTIYTA